MTPRQAHLYAFIQSYFREHDRFPTSRESAQHMGIVQTAVVHHMHGLRKAGLIEKDGHHYRFRRKG